VSYESPSLASNDTSSNEFPLLSIVRLEELLHIPPLTILAPQGSSRPKSVHKIAELQTRLRAFRNDQLAAVGDPNGQIGGSQSDGDLVRADHNRSLTVLALVDEADAEPGALGARHVNVGVRRNLARGRSRTVPILVGRSFGTDEEKVPTNMIRDVLCRDNAQRPTIPVWKQREKHFA